MTAGLAFTDLRQWRKWAERRRRIDSSIRSLRPSRPAVEPASTLWMPPGPARTLVVVDRLTPSCAAAISEPLAHLDASTTAVLTFDERAFATVVPADSIATRWDGCATDLTGLTHVLSLGSFLPLGSQAKELARRLDIRFSVVQHGLLTPWSPPAADGDHLLAWTQQDAQFWRAGNKTVSTQVVGSQMLWAGTQAAALEVTDDRPIMLGQLHGTELPRRQTLREYVSFCRSTGAQYRPHPNESDQVSRVLHRAMRGCGVEFASTAEPLSQLRRPIVSIFSTGTLEAAHRGLPAWVHHARPPAWVDDFWHRYDLAPWGGPATRAWHRPEREPAAAVAEVVSG